MVIRDPVSQLPFTSGGERERSFLFPLASQRRGEQFFFFFFSPPPIVTPVFIPSTPFIAIPRNIQAWNLNKARRETERERTLSKRPGHPPVLFFSFSFFTRVPRWLHPLSFRSFRLVYISNTKIFFQSIFGQFNEDCKRNVECTCLFRDAFSNA